MSSKATSIPSELPVPRYSTDQVHPEGFRCPASSGGMERFTIAQNRIGASIAGNLSFGFGVIGAGYLLGTLERVLVEQPRLVLVQRVSPCLFDRLRK